MLQPIYKFVKRGKKEVRILVGWRRSNTKRAPSMTPKDDHAAAVHLAAHPWLGQENLDDYR